MDSLRRAFIQCGILSSCVYLVLSECPDLGKFMHDADNCLRPLSRTINQTLVGQFSEADYSKHCSLYYSSVECVDTLLQTCPDDHTLQLGATLKTGIGQLCDNKATFQRYLSHAPCYARFENASLKCIVDFGHTIRALSAMLEKDYASFDDSMMCNAFSTLLSCVDKIIKTHCGEDASGLYDEIVKSQVPREVFSMCENQPVRYRDKTGDSYDEDDEDSQQKYVMHTDTNSGIVTTHSGLGLIVSFALCLLCLV